MDLILTRMWRHCVPVIAFALWGAVAAAAGTISISQPSNSQTVSSPFRVVASASDADGVRTMQVWLDGSLAYQVHSSKLDKSFSAGSGTHRLTVQAYDGKSNKFTQTIYVTVSGSSSASSNSTSSSSAKVYSDIEERDGWKSCTACAGGGGSALYSMTRHISSPSLDGDATKFWIGGTKSWSHGLWWRWMSSDTQSSNFVLDMYVYIKEPGKSEGLEFAANQAKDKKWYKWSTQCSFGTGRWRVWNTKSSYWAETGIACTRPKAYAWTHYVFEYQRVNGQAKFISISVNGKKYYVNKSFYPLVKDYSGSVGVHYQMNGNKYQHDYTTWVDNMTLKTW